jgi:hypothetical protein
MIRNVLSLKEVTGWGRTISVVLKENDTPNWLSLGGARQIGFDKMVLNGAVHIDSEGRRVNRFNENQSNGRSFYESNCPASPDTARMRSCWDDIETLSA